MYRASAGTSSRTGIVAAVGIAAFVLACAPGDAATGQSAGVNGATVAATPRAGSLFMVPERVRLENGELLDAERGVLFVPAVRAEGERSGLVGIELYRFHRHSDTPPDAPPVFLLHGGPGFPGLAGRLERDGYYEQYLRPFTAVGDLVVIGQRGIGSSRPNTLCDAPEPAPLDRTLTDAEAVAALRAALRTCRRFWEEKGVALQGFNVIEAAADVNDVREALGYDQVILQGTSFGSHWSMAIMRFHPEIVVRALLSGMEGPDHTYDMPSEVLAAMARIGQAAASSPGFRGRIPEGGLMTAFREVVERVQDEPVEAVIPDAESGEELRVGFGVREVWELAYGYTGHTSGRLGIRTWPADVLRLYEGDFRKAAEVRVRHPESRRYSTASSWMLDCGSGISRARLEKLKRDPAQQVLGRIELSYEDGCPVWETDLGVAFRRNFETSIPTVIVHGTWDTSTPIENARELSPYFKESAYVEVEGGSHGALWEALEADDSFRMKAFNFLRTGELGSFPDRVVLPPLEWELPEDAETPVSHCRPREGHAQKPE